MNRYTFRAECIDDAQAFLRALGATYDWRGFTVIRADGFPDVECAIETVASLAEALRAANMCDDCHRIAETLVLA